MAAFPALREPTPCNNDKTYNNAGGGDTEAAVEQSILLATGIAVDINLYGKSDDVNASSLFSFTPVNLATSKVGTWDVLDNTVLIRYVTIKGANSYALYDVGGVNSGSFSTVGLLNNGGQQPNVSHMSFWTTNAAAVP